MGITPSPMTNGWTTLCRNSLKNSIHHTSKGNLGWVSHLLTCSFFVLLLSSSLPNTESPHCYSPGGRSLDSHPTPPAGTRLALRMYLCVYGGLHHHHCHRYSCSVPGKAECQPWKLMQRAGGMTSRHSQSRWPLIYSLTQKVSEKSLTAPLLSTVFEFLNNEHSVFV